jgi:hypothetical protein
MDWIFHVTSARKANSFFSAAKWCFFSAKLGEMWRVLMPAKIAPKGYFLKETFWGDFLRLGGSAFFRHVFAL